MVLVGFFIFLFIVILILGHIWTTSRDMDSMGLFGGKDFQDFLGRRSQTPTKQISDIPPPPGGHRDFEVEALILKGQLQKAKRLLMDKMEEARLAPVGSAKRIAIVSHYIDFLNDPAYYSDL